MKRILSGIQPSNKLTLGNYLGAIKYFVELQNDYQMYIFVADLHAITNVFDPKTLADNKLQLVASYQALGLDVQKNIIFYQSDVHSHAELGWVLTCHSTIGELNKMTQFKDKTAKLTMANGTQTIPTGLFVYPTLMAADILLYDPDFVTVGIDQKQHVELTRNLAIRMNNKYGDLFKVPEPMIPKNGAKIMDLLEPSNKMSKSSKNENGTIFLLDLPEVASKKIMSAKTDSLNQVKYDPINQPGISNLLTIYSCLTNKSFDELTKQYEGKNYGEFKKDLGLVVSKFLTDFQSKYKQVIENPEKLEKQLKINAQKCLELTTKKVDLVYRAIGLRK